MALDISLYYQFISSAGASVIVRRGFGPPRITAGGARWTEIQRPMRTSVVQWDGVSLYKMDVPILWDGWISKTQQETDIAKLNHMRFPPSDLITPPTVRIEGAVPVKDATWVIEDIEWDEQNVIYRENGDRLRDAATIKLMQFVKERRLVIAKPSAGADSHRVVQGDNMNSISKKWYGDTTHKKIIMKANGIRDEKSIKVGQILKIPRVSH